MAWHGTISMVATEGSHAPRPPHRHPCLLHTGTRIQRGGPCSEQAVARRVYLRGEGWVGAGHGLGKVSATRKYQIMGKNAADQQ